MYIFGLKKSFFSAVRRYKWQSQIKLQKGKASLQKALTKISLNDKSLILTKKGNLYFYPVTASVAPACAFFLWHWSQDLLSVHTMFCRLVYHLLPHMNVSLIQTWPCAPELLSPESKSFTTSLRIIMNMQIKSDVKRCVYFFALNHHVLCHRKM